MPELPEVQTTVNGLNEVARGRRIVSIESTYRSSYKAYRSEIKNPTFFKKFKEKVVGQKILKAERRAKNILIHLSNHETILVHMKMTGHFVYNKPDYPHIRLILHLDNGKPLAFSDLRKFAKVALLEPRHLEGLGPEPLDPSFKLEDFRFQLAKKPRSKIKTVLMNPNVIAGIGNIYSDEILWRAQVHPLSLPNKIPEKNVREMFKAMKELLQKGLSLGGDSMSDYKNINGEKGHFQEHHRAYMRHNTKCMKKGCAGILKKLKVGGRSAHFCPKHQKLFT